MDSRTSQALIAFDLNGKTVEAAPMAGERLSETLRETIGDKSVKVGCNAGDCGACTVLVDGAPVCACLTPTQQVTGTRVETLSGLALRDPDALNLARAFEAHGAAQCGICTPGMIVSAVALLRRAASPSENDIKDALGGVLCRCTGYRKIITAVADAGADAGARDVKAPDATGHVGAALPRLDGLGKVTGTEKFGDDIAPAGTLDIRLIRSPHARAGFAFGDLSGFLAATPGLVTVLTAADIPGRNLFGVIPDFVDQPVFAESEARFPGEAVAAVVGTPDAIAAFEDEAFPVTWDERPAVVDIQSALAIDAPQLHADRNENVMCRGFVACGDAENALENADVTAEGTFTSGFVEHAYIEPEAGFAEIVDGRVEIHACTQAPVMDLEAIADILGVDRAMVRIVPTGVGGGFGSKLDLSVQPYLALAALTTGHPVRLCYERRESMQSTTKRHPSDIHLRVGAARDGRLCGFSFQGKFDTGAYASWGPTVSTRVPVHASGPYLMADYRAEALAVHTHNPPAGAFRGFGVPQAAIAQECLFDDLAGRLEMDRLAFRRCNALRNGDQTVCGQVFAQGVGIAACLEALVPHWTSALKLARAGDGGAVLRGVGVASGWYGCGNTSLPNPSTIRAGIQPDGTLVMHQGAADIGQGSNTAITQIFATAFKVPVSTVKLVGADTDRTPDAGKTSASRQTFVTGNAAKLAGEALRRQVLVRVNASDNAEIAFGSGAVLVSDGGRRHRIDLAALAVDEHGYVLRAEETYDPPTRPLDENGQGEPYAQFGYTAQMAEVAVDAALGTVKVLRVVAAHDVGRAINPLLVEGQVEGGVAQGLGMALMEEYVPGRTENLHDYLIPTIGDVPPIETIIIEEPDAHGPFGAKGLGEHALIPTAPAILNAINHACGIRLRQVPATPARIRAAMKGRD